MANDVVADTMDRLRGRGCGLIESWGLEDKRERGMINTFKSLTYDSQKEIAEYIKELISEE